MDAVEFEIAQIGLLHPYLQGLWAAQVPVDEILLQAEILGYSSAELVRIAACLVPCGFVEQKTLIPVCLALGATRNWTPFVSEARHFGLELLMPLIWPVCGELNALVGALGIDRWRRFCRKVLRRLGYPFSLLEHPSGGLNPDGVLPWLETGQGLVADGFELNGFTSAAPRWHQILVESLILRSGRGPWILAFGCNYWNQIPGPSAIRLFRVKRLRELKGLRQVTTLAAVDCPDLENIDTAPTVLILKDCPSLLQIPFNTNGALLHLERCSQLQAIVPHDYWDSVGSRPKIPTVHTVVISECPVLRELPPRLKVTGRMTLHRMGPFKRWPTDFQIGGDLRIHDCPDLEELPVLEVSGSIRVDGMSGLRRLAPGSVIGKHLDLRMCAQLEGIPRGVKVGGCLYLPPHLHRRAAEAFENQEPLLDMPRDRYPILRSLLMGLRFAELAVPGERCALRNRAEAALEVLREDLREHPGLEPELLWTASEVWRDLAEERWDESQPWCVESERAEPSDELPLAWFRGLLLAV